jgi:ABC-type branched-subunit amino acid transport system permease subunit
MESPSLQGAAARSQFVTKPAFLVDHKIGQWVFVVPGAIFVVCVLLLRRGIVGELAHHLRIKL